MMPKVYENLMMFFKSIAMLGKLTWKQLSLFGTIIIEVL
jgi:hypothetical protein